MENEFECLVVRGGDGGHFDENFGLADNCAPRYDVCRYADIADSCAPNPDSCAPEPDNCAPEPDNCAPV